MKTVRFILEMLASLALLSSTVYADPAASYQRPDQTVHAPAKPQRSRIGDPSRSNLQKHLPKRQTHVPSARATNPLPGLDGSSVGANGALIRNPMAERRPSVQLPTTAGVAALPLSNVHHRSPNPAAIAGSADVGKRNTGAIDGKQAPRRP